MLRKIFRFSSKIIILLLLLALFFVQSPFSFADELDETREEKEQKAEEAKEKEKQLFEAKIYEGSLSSQLSAMLNDLYSARASYENAVQAISAKEAEIAAKEQIILEKEAASSFQTQLIEARIRDLYKNSQYSPLTYLMLSDDFNKVNSEYIYRLNIIRQDKIAILDLKAKIAVLNEEKASLEQDKISLDAEKQNLETQKISLEAEEAYLNTQIAAIRNEQNELVSQLAGLNNQIASLSEKEKQILAEKAAAAAESTTVGDEEDESDNIETPTPQKASGDYYSFWSYGFPHRVGMNQYGAYGRALAGQDYSKILSSYYANTELTSYPVPDEINVQGYGWIAFEDLYLKGIGEMPSSWSMEALKAQAVAARTYALSYIGYANYSNYSAYRSDPNVHSICVNQACQVFIGHIKDERWAQAVDETRGKVLLSGGVPITAYYASTAGGATLSSEEVWGGYRSYALGITDTDSAGQAFDGPAWGDSPWYHKCWGDTPWLSKEAVADLMNAALLPDSYNDHLPASPNGFTSEEVVAKLQEAGIAVISDIKSIEITVGGSRTESLRVYYGNTYANISPERFRFAYNLRSPGTDALWSSRFDIQTN